jgi:hypothetical protein
MFGGFSKSPMSSVDNKSPVDTDGTIKKTSSNGTVPQMEVQLQDGSLTSEPNLHKMIVQFAPDKNEIFYAYRLPDVATLYNRTAGTKRIVEPSFTGLFVKIINMSPATVQVYGASTAADTKPSYRRDIEPYGCTSSTCYGNDTVLMIKEGATFVHEFVLEEGKSLYYYDPFQFNINEAEKQLQDDHQLHLYRVQLLNRAFASQYKIFTGGTDWLGLYKYRKPPR